MPEGDAIAARINALAASGDYDLVVATRDWHPPDHSSFAEQGGPWPVHCVAGTPGRRSCTRISTARAIDVIVDKGQAVDTDGYSGFEGTDLDELLRERGITAGRRSSAWPPTTASRTPRSTPCARASRSRSTATPCAASRSSRATPSARWPRCAPPAA